MNIRQIHVGDGKTASSTIKIVHISDTHTHHDAMLEYIPDGDILVHSGDFSKLSIGLFNKQPSWRKLQSEVDNFFAKLPFEHKIFVAGNHDMSFDGEDQTKLKSMFSNVHYLFDDSVTIKGIKFYGSPWTAKRWTSLARGFSRGWSDLDNHWKKIPKDTDVLVTHMPPYGIMDLAPKKFHCFTKYFSSTEICDTCLKAHDSLEHRGCKNLRETVVNEVRPKCHLFGHIHERNGFEVEDGITFSNAAVDIVPDIHVIDYHIQ